MFSRNLLLGLDIGSKNIKLVLARPRRKRIEPLRMVSMPTPPGAVDTGIIHDPQFLGESLSELVRAHKLTGVKTIAAVSGQQVYTRKLVMPEMKPHELREAAINQSISFLPIPTEEAAIDLFTLRNFSDDEGKKVEIFYVAARKAQVDSLDIVCQTAGLKLKAVEIEPLALYRTLLRDDTPYTVNAILNIGASRSYMAVFEGPVLSLVRNIAFGCSVFYLGMVGGTETDAGNPLEEIDLTQDGSHSYLIGDIITELSRTMEYYALQNMGQTIERIVVCGGGARLKGLDVTLAGALGCKVEIAQLSNQIRIPAGFDESMRSSLIFEYPVALGLAAREVL